MNGGTDDDRLRQAYAALMAKRGASTAPPVVPVEEIHALAEGSWHGPDREARLEAVLSDPETAAEFAFFLDLERERPAPVRRVPRWMPIAASILATVGLVAGLRTLWPAAPDAFRGTEPAVQLIEPAPGAFIEAGATFAWHPVENASDYLLEVIDDEGNSLLSAATIDTTYLMPADLAPSTGVTYRWWVVARLMDGTELRAAPRAGPGR